MRCCGRTTKNEQCTRIVKAPPPLDVIDPDAKVNRYCFQHQSQRMKSTGYYIKLKGEDYWISFEGSYHAGFSR